MTEKTSTSHIPHVRLGTLPLLAERSDLFVASYIPGGVSELAAALGCDTLAACRVGLCRPPRPGEDLERWADQVAAYAGVDKERLCIVARTVWQKSSFE